MYTSLWNSNLGDPILLWILRTILVFVLLYCGYHISNENKENYRKYALISTIFYSLIEGLRWMRGVDYWHYYQDIATNFKGIGTTPDPEPLYKLFCNIFYYSGLPISFAFVFYSAILFISFLAIIKHYKKIAIWALPLFYIITVNATENHIRQFFAIPFILFALSAWLDNKKVSCYILLCFAPLIHASTLFAIAPFLLFTHWNIKLPSKGGLTLLIIYIFLFFTWDINKLGTFSSWLQTIDALSDSKFDGYIDNADRWFSADGSISEVTGGAVSTSAIRKYISLISSSIIIYYGYKISSIDINKKNIVIYIFSCTNLFIALIGGDIELFGRFSEMFLIYIPIEIAIIIVGLKKIEYAHRNIIYVTLFVIYFLYYFLRYWGTNGISGSGFIWDK